MSRLDIYIAGARLQESRCAHIGETQFGSAHRGTNGYIATQEPYRGRYRPERREGAYGNVVENRLCPTAGHDADNDLAQSKGNDQGEPERLGRRLEERADTSLAGRRLYYSADPGGVSLAVTALLLRVRGEVTLSAL